MNQNKANTGKNEGAEPFHVYPVHDVDHGKFQDSQISHGHTGHGHPNQHAHPGQGHSHGHHPHPHHHHHHPAPIHDVPKNNLNPILAALAVCIIAIVLGAAYTAFKQPAKVTLPAKSVEAKTEIARSPTPLDLGLEIARDFETELKAPSIATPNNYPVLLKGAESFLAKYQEKYPQSGMVVEAQRARERYLQQVLGQSFIELKQNVLDLVVHDEYAKAAAMLRVWEVKGGAGYHDAVNKELEKVKLLEKQEAKAAFDYVNDLIRANDWEKAGTACDFLIAHIVSHFSPEYGSRALELREFIRDSALNVELVDKSIRENSQKMDAVESDKREKALYEKLVGELREPLAKMDIAAARQLVESYRPQLAGSSKDLEFVSLTQDVVLVDLLRRRLSEVAARGGLKDVQVAFMGGKYPIIGAADDGPTLKVQQSTVGVRWIELAPEALKQLAQSAVDPTMASDQHQLGAYLYQVGDFSAAENALVTATKLGATVDTLLARVRNALNPKSDSTQKLRSSVASAPRSTAPEFGQLRSQQPEMMKALNSGGWSVSKGYWKVTPQGTFYGEWRDASYPLLSLKHELKRFKSLSVEVRAIGDSVGFSFGKDIRFVTRPTERWQKLELQVGANDALSFVVDGVKVESSEKSATQVNSEQLPEYLYLRCVGRSLEVRGFKIDDATVGEVDLPWLLVRSYYQSSTQGEDSSNLMNARGWRVLDGRWLASSGRGYLALPSSSAAVLRRPRPQIFRRISVEFRGDGDAAGFDFGGNNRYLAKPTEKWQTLMIEVGLSDRLVMTVDGNNRNSIHTTQDIPATLLPSSLNLFAFGGAVEFRQFSIDGNCFDTIGSYELDIEPVSIQSSDEIKRIQAQGYEISSGVWKLEGDGSLCGLRVEGNDLVALKHSIPAFKEVSVELRGDGDLAGFSFGLGKRWSVRPLEVWQKLQLKVREDGTLHFLVNGETRGSVEDTRGVDASQLGQVIYLRGVCVNVQFRNFKVSK